MTAGAAATPIVAVVSGVPQTAAAAVALRALAGADTHPQRYDQRRPYTRLVRQLPQTGQAAEATGAVAAQHPGTWPRQGRWTSSMIISSLVYWTGTPHMPYSCAWGECPVSFAVLRACASLNAPPCVKLPLPPRAPAPRGPAGVPGGARAAAEQGAARQLGLRLRHGAWSVAFRQGDSSPIVGHVNIVY